MKRARTKIVCTIGPASGRMSVLGKMIRAGMDVARLNFSHGDHEQHLVWINLIRDINRARRKKILILQDLEGYRIRLGEFKNSVTIRKGQKLTLVSGKIPRKTNEIPFDFQGSFKSFKPGQSIFIDDGQIELVVRSVFQTSIDTAVSVPGTLKSRKGVNVPSLEAGFKGMSRKDTKDVEFGIRNGVDYIAQSFVRSAKDISELKRVLRDLGSACPVIAKIENRQGIENLDEIIKISDGIMVARGDLGVTMPIRDLPFLQKKIIAKCKQMNKLVITATQMLESMTERIVPTRAEVTDVANAVIDGSDWLMLSAETAVGKYPAETVKMMDDLIRTTEEHLRQAAAKEVLHRA